MRRKRFRDNFALAFQIQSLLTQRHSNGKGSSSGYTYDQKRHAVHGALCASLILIRGLFGEEEKEEY